MRASVTQGAKLLTGGKRLDGAGYFYAPTVLADIPPDSPAARDELFGPVASVFRANSLDEAIAIANGTSFGLGASAWTRDRKEQSRFVEEIESGLLFINGMVAVRCAPAVRRRQELGLRPRAGRIRDPRVREHQNGESRQSREREEVVNGVMLSMRPAVRAPSPASHPDRWMRPPSFA